MLEITNLDVKSYDKEILKNFSLKVRNGEIHVLMGPNGVGKSTICKAIMGHPDYQITNGEIKFLDNRLNELDTTKRAQLGLFLLNQNPVEIDGITNAELLRTIIGEKRKQTVDIFKFNKKLNEICQIINLPKDFVHRSINYNMSGGEKKKNELLHLFMLEPKLIILDEIDSGLDIDALKTVGKALNTYYEKYKPSILIITHHADILKYFDQYIVHIMENGTIVKSGNKDLIKEIENDGFKANLISGQDNDE